MTDDRLKRVTDLLRRAGSAHGVYEETELNGVYDDAWAAWYAAWALERGLNDLLGSSFDVGALTSRLTEINDAHQRAATEESWAVFTARRLVGERPGPPTE